MSTDELRTNPIERFRRALRPEMGTECIGPLLYWLVRSTRAERVLEIGAGYTTLLLAQALQDNRMAFGREREALIHKSRDYAPFSADWSIADPPLSDPGYYLKPYEPHMVCIDNGHEAGLDVSFIQQQLSEIGVDSWVELLREPFAPAIVRMRSRGESFDVIWFDCGGYPEYSAFVKDGWPLLSGRGGLLILHYTLTNLEIGHVVKELKLRQATDAFCHFELLSVLEPHKWSQNSYSIVRKLTEFDERIYGRPDQQMIEDLARLLSDDAQRRAGKTESAVGADRR